MAKEKTQLREPVAVGAFALSIQAGIDFASYPATDGLELSEYTHLEVTILKGDVPATPAECGISEFSIYFQDDYTARCLAAPVLDDLKRALESQA